MFDDRIGNLQKMLARMGPEGRQRYAADHADDPIAVSMALFVNNIAKELKEGKRGEPEMQAPVVQQAIQAMNQPRMPQGMPPQGMPPQGQPQAPQGMPPPQGQTQMAADGGYMDSRLPEEMGIGALPERSLSNMADGGIVGYADGGDVQSFQVGGVIAEYKAYAMAKAAKMGVSPALVDTIFTIESGYDPKAKSPTGPVGIGQLTKATGKAYGVRPEDRNKPYKNIDASIAFIADLQKKYGNDASKIAVAYNQGEPVLDAHLKINRGSLNLNTLPKEAQGYLKKLNNLLPMASANAAETVPTTTAAPAPVAAAPAAAPKKSIEERIRETLLPPVDTKPFTEVPRGMAQGLASQIAGLASGIAGAVMPGKEGQGAEAAKRAEQAVGGYEPTSESSKKILDALGYLPNIFSEYVSKPVGETIDKVTGSTTAGDIATRISDLVPLLIPVGRGGKPKLKTAEAAPVPAAVPVPAPAPTPAVRTVPTPAQVAAGNPTAVKPTIALPPPDLASSPTVVPTPKADVKGGLPDLLPEAAKLRAEAVARKDARAAERAAAAKATEKPVAVEPIAAAADAVKAAEAAKAADAQVAAGSRAALQIRPEPLKLPRPSVVGAGAVGAGAAAIDGANNVDAREPYSTGDYQGKSGIADLDIGPEQKRPSFDRTSGDDTTQFPSITPEIAKEAVALAKDEIPKKEQGGFGYEDLLMFGLNLMAGQSPNALTNVGTAGIAALTARQARAKAEADKRKSESEALRDTAYGEYYKDKIAQGPEERRLAAEDKKLAAEDRRKKIENETQDRANALVRQREADQVTRQAKADDALKDSKEYNTALMEAQIARLTFDKISDPTQQQKDKFLRSQEIPRMMKREAYKGFGINPTGLNTSSAGWNIAPAP